MLKVNFLAVHFLLEFKHGLLVLFNPVIQLLGVHLGALFDFLVPLVQEFLLALQQYKFSVLLLLRKSLIKSFLHVLLHCDLDLLKFL